MALLELLMQKLPESRGWPKEAVHCIYHEHKGGVTFYGAEGDMVKNGVGFIDLCIPDVRRAEVTREHYEAALAACKPEWDGEVLPPVGCRLEVNCGGEWVEATVAYTDRPDTHGDAVAWKEVLVFDCKTTRPFWSDEFRPIRSEADKKRAEGVIALSRIDPQAMPFEYGDKHSDVSLIGPFWYELYDAIAAGKIPHIRID